MGRGFSYFFLEKTLRNSQVLVLFEPNAPKDSPNALSKAYAHSLGACGEFCLGRILNGALFDASEQAHQASGE